MVNFDDDEINKLNKNIIKIIITISSQLRAVDKLIKTFAQQNIDINNNNSILHNIKLNMKQCLFNKLSEFTKKFKLNQEINKQKYKYIKKIIALEMLLLFSLFAFLSRDYY